MGGKKDKGKKKDRKRQDAPSGPAGVERLEQPELLSMDEAIGILKTTRPTFYRWLKAGRIKGHKIGRQWRFYPEDIERFLKGEAPRVEPTGDLGPLLAQLRDDLAATDQGDERADDSDPPLEQAVQLILAVAAARRAECVHVHPVSEHDAEEPPQAELRLRVDGTLHALASFERRALGGLVAQFKTLAGCDATQHRLPQDGRAEMRLAGGERSLRLSFLPVAGGESVTVRLLSPDEQLAGLDDLVRRAETRDRLREALGRPSGMVVIAAPPGNQAGATLNACLREAARPERMTLSVADTVERELPGVVHVPARPDDGLELADAVRAAVRSQPDVLAVERLDSPELAALACQAALDGRLVLTTVRAADAATGVRRLMDLGLSGVAIAEAVRMVVALRRLRRLCEHCRRATEPNDDDLWHAGEVAAAGGLNWEAIDKQWFEPVGCERCSYGWRGYVPAVEVLDVSPPVASALRNAALVNDIAAAAVGAGMVALSAEVIRVAAEGRTSLREALRVLASV